MSCPGELEWSMYVDEALDPDETRRLAAHVASCAACSARVDALRTEVRALRAALAAEDDVAIPAFRPTTHRTAPVGAAAVLIALASSSILLGELLGALRWPESLGWLNPFTLSDAIDVLFTALLFIATEGRSMLTSTIETMGAAVVVVLVAAAALAAARRGGGAAVFSAALAAIAFSTDSEALEIRKSDGLVSVPASETIDDTLIAFGHDVEIDGRVTGDLIAFAQRVVIRGAVDGQVVTAGRRIELEGELGGSMLGAAETIAARDGAIGRNLYGFVREITIGRDVEIVGNGIIFASGASIAGAIGRDVYAFAADVEATGRVGGDLIAYTSSLRVRDPARIEGNVIAHVGDERSVSVSPGTVVGEVDTRVSRERGEERDDGPGAFLAGQAVRFAAAFVTGLILLWLVPPFTRMSLDTAGEVVTSAGVGLIALVAVPIIAVMTAITLIGLPIAVLAMLAWLAALYLAKIVVAHFVGKTIFDRSARPAHFALALLVGLLLVFVAINIPFVGGLFNFVLTITGLGMIVILVWGLFRDRSEADA